ncbi:hypothetical protein F7725_026913 [Dissostichus mawsoni]|uniref:Uncharacterized protein n=1 Tax=Dissostichus mawsoni TaxID=36200 RepID=A0A7J5X9Z1_DISMA|nr:hypothetical protein F7725_026913 [Dissostichus mawsoni]
MERTRKEYPGTEVQTGTRSSERGDEEQDRPGRWLDVAGRAAGVWIWNVKEAGLGRCQCNNCNNMDTVAESVCCREIPAVTRTMEEDGVHSCIIDHPGFRSGCLDIWCCV